MRIAQNVRILLSTVMATVPKPSSWHAAYPAPKQASSAIDRPQVLELLRSDAGAGKKNFILVDLRRNDHEVRSMFTW